MSVSQYTLDRAKHQLQAGERARTAMIELIDACNTMNAEDAVVTGMVEGLLTSHRTLQSSFMRNFISAMGQYKDAATDARNEGAVKAAAQISDVEVYLPFI